jgi:hypothetical protein
MKLIMTLAAVAFSFSAFAAPMPATSTSKLVAPQLGLYRSPIGFEISAGKSGWIHGQAPGDSKFVQTVYRSPNKQGDVAPSLTVRIDKLDKPVAMNKYIQRWQKEYPKYGFDVLGSKPFTEGNNKGFVLDLMNRDSNKQIRQVVYMKASNAVILTCRDQANSFKNSLKGCNEIIRTFKWVE